MSQDVPKVAWANFDFFIREETGILGENPQVRLRKNEERVIDEHNGTVLLLDSPRSTAESFFHIFTHSVISPL